MTHRVAVLSDVHANVAALDAVLAEVIAADPDLVVFGGDLTWGPEPELTMDIATELGERAVFVRGNADRAIVELARGDRSMPGDRPGWLLGQHSARSIEFLAGFEPSVTVEVTGLGPVRICHGSPRDDTEHVTPDTPADRFAALAEPVAELTLVTGHTHLQFDRMIAGRRSVGPGSVGLPYHDREPGVACWALLGPDVELRQTPYDVTEAVSRCAGAGDPAADRVAALLLAPPPVAEVIARQERTPFSD